MIESNEAFAAEACAVARELGFDPDKTNPNGTRGTMPGPLPVCYEFRKQPAGCAEWK